MANKNSVPNDDEDLDPTLLKIQSRLRRLMLGSSLFTVLGIMAVFAAIIYRINQDDNKVQPTQVTDNNQLIIQQVQLPTDLGALIDTSVANDQLVLTFKTDEQTHKVLIVNRPSGEIIEQYSLKR